MKSAFERTNKSWLYQLVDLLSSLEDTRYFFKFLPYIIYTSFKFSELFLTKSLKFIIKDKKSSFLLNFFLYFCLKNMSLFVKNIVAKTASLKSIAIIIAK